uniref:Uncharacterized protein n=1 Tax=Anas platyrhynchos TaxID=8839 RepID=A0A8B9R3G4_ANAPL
MYRNHGSSPVHLQPSLVANVTTPVTTDLESYLIISVIVVGLDSFNQLCKGSLILPVGDRLNSYAASI